MGETFKLHDFVIFEFKIGQITEMEDNRVVAFSDGFGTTSSRDLSDRCVPLTLPMMRIAGEFEYHSKRIHKEGSSGLNYPRIHDWLVTAWREACNHPDDLKPHYEKVKQFTEDILRAQQVDSGYGFDLLRTR